MLARRWVLAVWGGDFSPFTSLSLLPLSTWPKRINSHISLQCRVFHYAAIEFGVETAPCRILLRVFAVNLVSNSYIGQKSYPAHFARYFKIDSPNMPLHQISTVRWSQLKSDGLLRCTHVAYLFRRTYSLHPDHGADTRLIIRNFNHLKSNLSLILYRLCAQMKK